MHNERMCDTCKIQPICSIRKEIDAIQGVTLSMEDCVYYNSVGNSPTQNVPNAKQEHLNTPEEIMDRAQKIKEIYDHNADEVEHTEFECPTCGGHVTKIYHCAVCGKEICAGCMVTLADRNEVYCDDCW